MNSLVKKPALNKVRNMVAGASVGMSTVMVNMLTAHAANPWGNAETTLVNLFESLQTTLTNIVVPIAACAFIFCLIMMLVSSNQKKVEAYRSWAITIFVCVVGIFAVGFVINLAKSIGGAL